MEKQSLPTQEVCGSNPIIVKVLLNILTIKCIEKTKIKKKEAGNGQLKKRLVYLGANSLSVNIWSPFSVQRNALRKTSKKPLTVLVPLGNGTIMSAKPSSVDTRNSFALHCFI